MEETSKKISKNIFSVIIITLILMFFAAQTVGAKPANIPNLQTATEDIIIYGSGSYYGPDIVEINLSNYTYNFTGTASIPNQAMAQDPATGFIYLFEAGEFGGSEFSVGDDGNEFVYWDPATLTDTLVVKYTSLPGPSNFYAKRMDFSPDGTLYIMDNLDRIYSMDKQTGLLTSLNPVPGMVTGPYFATGDITFAPDGTAYVATYGNIYTLDYDPIADVVTPTILFENMFPVTGLDKIWTGLAFCDGALYGSSGEMQANGEWQSGIYRIDPDPETEKGDMVNVIANVGVLLNDITSCKPKVEICGLQANSSYDFYIQPFTATVDIETLGNLDCISMNRFNADHPEATTPLQTGIYWDITGLDSIGQIASGFNVTLTLPTTFTTDAQDKVCRYTGSSWDCAMDIIGSNSVTRGGIIQFSEWTVGNDTSPTSITLQSFTARKNVLPQTIGLLGLYLVSMIILVFRKRFFNKKS